MAVPEANLPEDIDATHDDRRPSDALHQQHHDLIHRVINALAGTGLDTETAALAADETSQLRGAFNDAYVNRATSFAALEPGHLFGHRGTVGVVAENTLKAFRYAFDTGCPVIEYDVSALRDGSLVVMHDDTVDRTTTGSGDVQDYDLVQWNTLRVDGTDITPPSFEEVLREFGHQGGLHCIHPKTGGDLLNRILTTLQDYKVSPDAAIINAFSMAIVDAAWAAGYHSCIDASVLVAPYDFADLTARGVTYVATATGLTAQEIADAHTAGLRVVWWPGVDRAQVDAKFAEGYDASTVDDPAWIAGSVIPRSSDTWALKAHGAGIVSNTVALPSFADTDALLIEAGQLVRIAEVSPTADATVTVDLDIELTTDAGPVTSDFRIFLADTDAQYSSGDATPANGYAGRIDIEGRQRTYRIDKGGAIVTLASETPETQHPNWVAGEERHYRLIITATDVTFTETVSGKTVSSTDATYRPDGGWFLHLGDVGGSAWKIRNLAVTST